MNEVHGFTLGGALGVATVEFAVVGAIAWLLRRRWRSAFGPPLVPAGILAGFKIMAARVDPLGMAQYALVSVVVGLVWWTIFAWRDGRRPKDDGAGR